MEEIATELRASDGSRRRGLWRVDEDAPACRLTLEVDDLRLEAEESDFFEAMCRIRERLEPLGLFPTCYGASRNVLPSGMARDMGRGLKAYKLSVGRRASTKDLVSIFGTGPDVDPVTVAEQWSWYRDLWKSLGHEIPPYVRGGRSK